MRQWAFLILSVMGLDVFALYHRGTACDEALPYFSVANLSPEGKVSLQLIAPQGKTYTLQVSTNLRTWSDLTNGTSHLGVVTFTIESVGGHRFKFFRARRVPSEIILAPETAEVLMCHDIVYTVKVAGQNDPKKVFFPLSGHYQIAQNGSREVGSVATPTRTGNTWTVRLTPDAGQQGAQDATVRLEFTAVNGGTWSYLPAAGEAETGTFIRTRSEPIILEGKTLFLTYPGGGEERFRFRTSSDVSYEDGARTGTYRRGGGEIIVDLTNGWHFRITLLDERSASVYFSSEDDPAATVTATATYSIQ